MLFHCRITWVGCVLILKLRKCTIVKTNMADHFGSSDILRNMWDSLSTTRLWYSQNKWKDAILLVISIFKQKWWILESPQGRQKEERRIFVHLAQKKFCQWRSWRLLQRVIHWTPFMCYSCKWRIVFQHFLLLQVENSSFHLFTKNITFSLCAYPIWPSYYTLISFYWSHSSVYC